MNTETWAMAPTTECLIEAGCTLAHKAGMYECPGCLGNGRRALLGAAVTITVALDHHGNPIGIETGEHGQ
jgi:hypothetical protein